MKKKKLAKLVTWPWRWLRQNVLYQRGPFKFQPGDYCRFDTYLGYMVDDDFGYMMFRGARVLLRGRHADGRKGYWVTFCPDGKLDHCKYPPQVFMFEDYMIPCTRDEFCRLEITKGGTIVIGTERVLKPGPFNYREIKILADP